MTDYKHYSKTVTVKQWSAVSRTLFIRQYWGFHGSDVSRRSLMVCYVM